MSNSSSSNKPPLRYGILIFSPNQIFTEYISNVLPELGEDNTLQTTFNDYLSSNITEFSEVEPFMDFIGKFYSEKVSNPELIRYKQSDEEIAKQLGFKDNEKSTMLAMHIIATFFEIFWKTRNTRKSTKHSTNGGNM